MVIKYLSWKVSFKDTKIKELWLFNFWSYKILGILKEFNLFFLHAY